MFEKSLFSGTELILVLWKLSNGPIGTDKLSCSTCYLLQAGVVHGLLMDPENTGDKFLFKWTALHYVH